MGGNIAASLLAILAAGMNAAPDANALSLRVERHGDHVEIRLVGHSAVSQQVRYDLVMTGNSTSQHRGKTALSAGRAVILSTMRMSVAEGWCVTVSVQEGSGRSYELAEGDCS